ncbi:MAG: methionine--tRNA ligase [Methylacidiphilales bacterium]|nr:methionine--tRNA ligase [Candidatus Methylacidiphilales bacterium]MDW8349106.1 methionine--tRNA ligase [Verrucomicrobiae bacterium]
MKRFFITTAIDYVNGKPHLGHAYEKILADVLARFQRNQGRDVLFLTGVDEHGQKVQQSARAANKAPQAFCDEMTAHFIALWKRLDIRYDRFARTTLEAHQSYVRGCLQRLYDEGKIVFKDHVGFYSVRQEQFVTEKDRNADGSWPEIYGEVVEMREPNYFFVMEPYRERIRERIVREENWIEPTFRRKELLTLLEEPLEPLCISRPKSRVEWGIPLPFDEQYVTYVWFDALLNYISFAFNADGTSRWPADIQLIGKDILIPAHGIYWPAMLIALGLEWPRRLLVHGWWMNRGAKMSKSIGNVVDPVPYIEHWGADAFRYFVMREMVTGQDADFSDERFADRYSFDLANDWGNLVQRTLSMVHRYRGGCVPQSAEEMELVDDECCEIYLRCMENGQVHAALEAVWSRIQRANRYVEERAPWRLAKEQRLEELDRVLVTLCEAIRRIGLLLEPVMPTTSRKVMGFLGEPEDFSFGRIRQTEVLKGRVISPAEPLFPRKEDGVRMEK